MSIRQEVGIVNEYLDSEQTPAKYRPEEAYGSDSRLQQHPLISSFRRQKIMNSPERSQQQVDSNSQLFNEKLKRSVSRIDH